MGKTIMEYIMEQADRYDGLNLKIEKRTRDDVINIYNTMYVDIMNMVNIYDAINSPLQLQTLINRISCIISDGYGVIYRILSRELSNHVKKGYNDMGDLIDIGMEISDRISRDRVSEMIVDHHTIEYMNHHAFEYVRKLSGDMENKLRTELTQMVLTEKYDKEKFSYAVENIMDTSTSRADMIAQTEMSMAYNMGMMDRMREFNIYSEHTMRKYWYGFRYSVITCEYCKPRIGMILDIDDNREELPAHPRCRCVWLPYMDGWDEPISMDITRKANMLKRVYSPDEIYRKIRTRLGINYAEHIPLEHAKAYIAGDRSDDILDAIDSARGRAISDAIKSFDIPANVSGNNMNAQYRTQMRFWKEYVAEHIVDNDVDELKRCHTAIKGVMALTWSGEQLHHFSKLLDIIDDAT